MPHPHRLTKWHASDVPALQRRAIRELQRRVVDAKGHIRNVATSLSVTEFLVHKWLREWGLRGWLNRRFPREKRVARAALEARRAKST